MSLSIDLVIATADRPESLAITLAALVDQASELHRFRLVVVDNGDPSPTQAVLRSVKDLHSILLVHPERHRANAMNAAWSQLRGDIVVFADDDITPSASWLRSYQELFTEVDQCIVGCGPITPCYPNPCPDWIKDTAFEGVLFARFEPSIGRSPLPLNLLPLGPNFAVRRTALRHIQMKESLGPSLAHGPLSCDDLDLLTELRNRHMPLIAGGGFFFSPSASVLHRVREEQLTGAWIYDRFFNYGRSVVAFRGRVGFFSSPSPLVRELPGQFRMHHESAELSYYLGQLSQLRAVGDNEGAAFLSEWLSRALKGETKPVLGPLGQRYLNTCGMSDL